jgi:hypothetical protein
MLHGLNSQFVKPSDLFLSYRINFIFKFLLHGRQLLHYSKVSYNLFWLVDRFLKWNQ